MRKCGGKFGIGSITITDKSIMSTQPKSITEEARNAMKAMFNHALASSSGDTYWQYLCNRGSDEPDEKFGKVHRSALINCITILGCNGNIASLISFAC